MTKRFSPLLCLLFLNPVLASSDFSINNQPLRELVGNPSGLGFLQMCPEGNETALNLITENKNLTSHWGIIPFDCDDLAAKKKQTGKGIIQISHLIVEDFKDQYGLIGIEGVDTVLEGKHLSLNQTSFCCQSMVIIQPNFKHPSFVQQIVLEKIPGCKSPLVQGKIDFTKTGWDIFQPLSEKTPWMAVGVKVGLLIDPRKL